MKLRLFLFCTLIFVCYYEADAKTVVLPEIVVEGRPCCRR